MNTDIQFSEKYLMELYEVLGKLGKSTRPLLPYELRE